MAAPNNLQLLPLQHARHHAIQVGCHLAVLVLPFYCAESLGQTKHRPRGTAGTQVVQYFDYGDRWTDGKVYLVGDVQELKDIPAEIPETRYGGRADRKTTGTGFFQVRKVEGRWYFVDPDGGLMHITGINWQGGKKGPVDQHQIDQEIALLRDAGFNAFHVSMDRRTRELAAIDIHFPYCANLMLTFNYLVQQHSGDQRMWDAPPLWDDALRESVQQRAREKIAKYANDPYLIGYFTDNEMHWIPEALDVYYRLYTDDAAYEVISTAWATRGQKYTVNPKDFRSYKIVAEWVERQGFQPNEKGEFTWRQRQRFQEFQAEQYAKLISEAIRQVDPNHLIMSARHIRQDGANPGMFRGLGKYFDAISINYYGAWPPDPVVLDTWESWSGRPTFVTEFSAQAFDTIPRQARDAFIVHSQADRGKYYQNAVLATLQNRNCVGTLWFCYADFPAPKEANYGIVNAQGQPYNDFLEFCREVNINRYRLIDCLTAHPLDYAAVYDPLRNVKGRDHFEQCDY